MWSFVCGTLFDVAAAEAGAVMVVVVGDRGGRDRGVNPWNYVECEAGEEVAFGEVAKLSRGSCSSGVLVIQQGIRCRRRRCSW